VESTQAFVETPLYLQAGRESVFAVLTSSVTPSSEIGVVLAHSGANNFSAHRNGLWTRLARRLAREGIASLRFDFAGTGESSGKLVLGLGQSVEDTKAAMDALRKSGVQRLLVVGSCFGAMPSVAAAADRNDVAALILLSPPLVLADAGRVMTLGDKVREVLNGPTLRAIATNRDYRQWFFTRVSVLIRTRAKLRFDRLVKRAPGGAPEAGVSHTPGRGLLLQSELARLITAGTGVEVVFGTYDGNLARVVDDPDAKRAVGLLQAGGPAGLRWTVLDGPVHGMEDVAMQEQLIALLLDRARGLKRAL
jgi:alpha/beta superfamily hydrolase